MCLKVGTRFTGSTNCEMPTISSLEYIFFSLKIVMKIWGFTVRIINLVFLFSSNEFVQLFFNIDIYHFQPVRFQLSHASDKQTGNQYAEREYSIWVSDLPGNISEEEFHKAFSSRFDTIKTAKLFKEKDNKVYGFVRFTG